MFYGVDRSGKASSREACRHHSRMRRPSNVQGLCHRTEVRHDSAALRCGKSKRVCTLLSVEPMEICHSGCCRNGTEYASRMPALFHGLVDISVSEFGQNLISGEVCARHVGAGGVNCLGLGKYGGNQYSTGMAPVGAIVVVECVRSGAINPGSLRCGNQVAVNERFAVSRLRIKGACEQSHCGVLAAADQ